MLPLAEDDSRLGFHSEAEAHQFHPDKLEWRIGQLDQTLRDLDRIDAELADGVKRAAEKFGGEEYAMHVGGAEPPAHDGRYDPILALNYAAEPAPGKGLPEVIRAPLDDASDGMPEGDAPDHVRGIVQVEALDDPSVGAGALADADELHSRGRGGRGLEVEYRVHAA